MTPTQKKDKTKKLIISIAEGLYFHDEGNCCETCSHCYADKGCKHDNNCDMILAREILGDEWLEIEAKQKSS